MLRFTLFGIPIVVEPWFWLTMAFLGGGLNALQRNYPGDYLGGSFHDGWFCFRAGA